jgi:hypothetical protein
VQEGLKVNDLLEWIGTYPLPVALTLCLAAGLLYITKVVVEKGVESEFDRQAKALEIRLNRRSSFEEMVLTRRFELMTSFSSSLQRVMTDLNRIRSGMEPASKGFMVGNEIVPLTMIFEDLEVHRLVLGPDLYSILSLQAQLALQAANEKSPDRWAEFARLWSDANAELRSAAEVTFGVTSIRW